MDRATLTLPKPAPIASKPAPVREPLAERRPRAPSAPRKSKPKRSPIGEDPTNPNSEAFALCLEATRDRTRALAVYEALERRVGKAPNMTIDAILAEIVSIETITA